MLSPHCGPPSGCWLDPHPIYSEEERPDLAMKLVPQLSAGSFPPPLTSPDPSTRPGGKGHVRDTMVEGIDRAGSLGWVLLISTLSDLCRCGGEPSWMYLALAGPKKPKGQKATMCPVVAGSQGGTNADSQGPRASRGCLRASRCPHYPLQCSFSPWPLEAG